MSLLCHIFVMFCESYRTLSLSQVLGDDIVLWSLFSVLVFFLMIRRPPRSTLDRSSAASDVYKRQVIIPFMALMLLILNFRKKYLFGKHLVFATHFLSFLMLSLIHISEPTRPY